MQANPNNDKKIGYSVEGNTDEIAANRYNDSPTVGVGKNTIGTNPILSLNNSLEEEVLFSNLSLDCCVCMVDMINSTQIVAKLDGAKYKRYYKTFIDSISRIAKNFGANVFKTAGDSVLYYFADTTDAANASSFRNVIECGVTMIAAHDIINAGLAAEKLPPLNYRISIDYGTVEIARSKTSQINDLFGPPMNLCAKINSRAAANSIVIGSKLYQIVKGFDDYVFEECGEYQITMQDGNEEISAYKVYSIKALNKRTILNPFDRVPSQH